MILLKIVIVYFCIISIISVFLTIYDKKHAINDKWRVPEKTLLLFGALGGAGLMFLCMKIIHHKTLKAKFMISLPLFFALHVTLIALAFYFKILP